MSNQQRVIRLETNGPAGAGLERMELDPADFQSELPEQHIHIYYQDQSLGLNIGVWTTTSMQEAFGPYPGDEFMWVLEGQVKMVDGDGKETLVKPGQTFCLRNAIPISWKQEGFLRKFFMTYADPDAPTPHVESADGGVRVLDADELQAGMQAIECDGSQQRQNIFFTNDSGNMTVGMWDCNEFDGEMEPYACHEMVQMLEGEVTITEVDGSEHLFRAGDVFFIPMGTVCRWQQSGYVKKFFANLLPAGKL